MAEHQRGRMIEQDNVLRNINDEELVRSIQSDPDATDLERHLAARLIHHKDRRLNGVCEHCGSNE